jgi:N-acetylmuramoyl-L-alanine amidase
LKSAGAAAMLAGPRVRRINVGKQRLPSPGKKSAEAGFGASRCRRVAAAVLAASLLLPIEVGQANWLSDVFKGSSKVSKPPKHAASAKPAASSRHRAAKSSASKSSASKSSASKSDTSKPIATICDPAKFRIVLDVGHTSKSEGATSARDRPEFAFNLHLAQRIEEKLKAAGFAGTKLLVTEGNARSSLVKRVAVANSLPADLFLAIHHDSVPNKLLEDWEFEGKKLHFSDRFSGYSVWVSRNNPEFKTSLSFAELLARAMKAQGLEYAHQYTQAIMGHYQHPILNKETGVYSYDQLVVLRKTRMPAVLLEAGSIINRDEELKMDSDERRDIVSGVVAAAMKKFCDARSAPRPDVAATTPPQDQPAAKPEQAAKPEAVSR